MRGDVVARTMRLIPDGTVDREGVTGLAARIGYTTRQLERLLQAEVGANPLALARAQRCQTARVLIETTDAPFGDVAFAAGFSSIRQFNDTVLTVCAVTPTALRERARADVRTPASRPVRVSSPCGYRFALPFAFEGLFGHLAASAVPGLEEFRDGAYRRTLRLASGNGIVSLTPAPIMWTANSHSTTSATCRRPLLGADGYSTWTPIPRRWPMSWVTTPYLSCPGRQGPGPTDPPHRRRNRTRGPHDHRPTGIDDRGAHAHARLVTAYGSPIADANGHHPCLSTIDPWRRSTRRPRVPHGDAANAHRAGRAPCRVRVDLDPGCDWERARHDLDRPAWARGRPR